MTHVLLKDDDESPTETATVAVVTQGTSRGEEKTGNTHENNSTQGATITVQRLVPCVTTATVAPCA
jgi:proline racemase